MPDSGHSGRVLRTLRRRSRRDVERRIVVTVPVFRNSVLRRDPTLRRPLPGLRQRRRRRLPDTGSGGRRPRTQTSGQMRRPVAHVMKLFCPKFTNVRNKLECLFLTSLSSLVYCLRVWPGGYPRVEHVRGTLLKGRLLTLTTNTRLGWKGMPGINTLAYYEHSYITDEKIFNIGPWDQHYETFYVRNSQMFVIS